MLNMLMLIGRIRIMISMQDSPIIGILSNLGYLILLIINNETAMANIIAMIGLNSPLRYNVAIMNEMQGIGNPMKSSVSIFPAITLYLVSLKTPQITINKLTSITAISKMPGVVLMQVKINIAGAAPNEITSESESIFFPKPKLSCLFVFRATQPSTESNMIAIIIRIAASSKLWLIEQIIDRNPELIFSKDMISDIAIKLFMSVSVILIFKLQ